MRQYVVKFKLQLKKLKADAQVFVLRFWKLADLIIAGLLLNVIPAKLAIFFGIPL